MSESISRRRAEMPTGASSVLDQRDIERSNTNLLLVLKRGKSVLDVGCGSGAITHGICQYTGPDALVQGIDRSAELIGLAKNRYGNIANLRFDCVDILDFNPGLGFDIVTTARTLQWIANPVAVIVKMRSLLNSGGLLCVLDYNHTRIEWDPKPPETMVNFYRAFLQWRSDAGMDNQIGDNIGQILTSEKMDIVYAHDQSEYCERDMPDFLSLISIWSKVAETRGKQLVEDKYLTEDDRVKALADYTAYCNNEARSMKLYLKATHASIPATAIPEDSTEIPEGDL